MNSNLNDIPLSDAAKYVIVDNKDIIIPETLRNFWIILKYDFKVNGTLRILDTPETKVFIQLLGGDSFKLGFSKGVWILNQLKTPPVSSPKVF